jgi:hypothetical protein
MCIYRGMTAIMKAAVLRFQAPYKAPDWQGMIKVESWKMQKANLSSKTKWTSESGGCPPPCFLPSSLPRMRQALERLGDTSKVTQHLSG